MAAHNYWRLRCPIRPAASYTEIGEMVLLDGSNTDLCVGGTASASSIYSGGYSAASAFDKVIGASGWCNVGVSDYDCWLQYQTASPVTPVAIRLSFVTGNFPSSMALDGADSSSGPWERFTLLGGTPRSGVTETYQLSAAAPVASPMPAIAPTVWSPQLPTEPVGVINQMRNIVVVDRDWTHGGDGVVYGHTYLDGFPDVPVGGRIVRLLREVDALPLRQTLSAPGTGYFEFRDLSPHFKYTVVAYDPTHDYRATIADNLTPELMA